ncbi:MAG: Tat pathway signal protein [Rhodospirillaceae bacterium]|nr:Tat pathway signal protein [Rhodospirillaceae bacterium]
MDLTRRHLLTLTAGGIVGLTALPFTPAFGASPGTAARYLGVRRLGDGRVRPYSFAACAADADGRILREVPLPARGHGFARHPSGRVGVAMARRPGTFAVAFELEGDVPPVTFHTPKDRHFQGHGVFEPEGRYLFATENDFEGERGCLGIYDSADGYKRVGEVPSHGVGCHELVLMPDGKTLAVANGGILTHPASGRAKLNIPTMAPSLAYVDLASGELMDKAEYTAGRKSKLSIRHLAATPDGRIVFACQDQGDTADGLDLVAMHRPGSGGLEEWPAPEGLTQGLAGYCGSVAVNTAGTLAAVSAPRGNRVLFWDTTTGKFAATLRLTDGCGIAPGPDADSFVLTSGLGAFMVGGPEGAEMHRPSRHAAAPWDNHLVRLGA